MLPKDWEDIVEEVIAHFTKSFCTQEECDQSEHFWYFPRDQDACIPPKEHEWLEMLLTQDDL